MNARSERPLTDRPGYEMGQRLYCTSCHAEIEVVNPSGREVPEQAFRCCGEAMRPNTSVAVHVSVEAQE